VLGHTRGHTDLEAPAVLVLDPIAGQKNGVRVFEGQHKITRSGSFSYGIRVRARPTADLDLSTRDLVLWA
jgi:hypothetical protein